MSSSPVVLTLPSDEDLQSASGSKSTYQGYVKKKPSQNIRMIDTPKEELKYRAKKSDIIEKEKLLCTTCGKDLKTHVCLSSTVFAHPVLGVLLCKSCADFYGEGEFSVDEDGTDKYCRWCGQGGTLYLCSECNFGFCRTCIKRNLQRSILKDVDDDDWKCFACNSSPLWDLRATCAAAMKFKDDAKKSKTKLDSKPSTSKASRKLKISSSESGEEQVKRKSDLQKKKKGRDSSSDTFEKKKRKRSDSGNEEMHEKKKKRNSSKASEGNKTNKGSYDKEVDRETSLDSKTGEKLASKCKEQIGDLLKVLRAISSEVKSVLKEEVVVENLLEYAGRKRLCKKMIMLQDMACQSISQVCENFVLAYQSGIVSCVNEIKNAKSESENIGKHESDEEKKQKSKDDEVIEKTEEDLQEKKVKRSVHQLSESDNNGDDKELPIIHNTGDKGENEMSEPENSKKKLKTDETALERNEDDSDNSEVHNCDISKGTQPKGTKGNSKKHDSNELNEKHVDSHRKCEGNDNIQEPSENDSCTKPEDASQSNKECDISHDSDSETPCHQDVDQESQKKQHSSKTSDDDAERRENDEAHENEKEILRDAKKPSTSLYEEKEGMSDVKGSEVSDSMCAQNADITKKLDGNALENDCVSESDNQLLQKEKGSSDISESDSGSIVNEKQSKSSSDKSATSTNNKEEVNASLKKIINDSDNDETRDSDERKQSKKKKSDWNTEKNLENKGKIVAAVSNSDDEDVISDSGSEKRCSRKNKKLSVKSQQDCSLESINAPSHGGNSLSDSDHDNAAHCDEERSSKDINDDDRDMLTGSDRETQSKKAAPFCKDVLSDNEKNNFADSNGEKHNEKTSSPFKDALSDGDRDDLNGSDTETQSKKDTPSSYKDALSDVDNLDSEDQILRSKKTGEKPYLKDDTTNSDSDGAAHGQSTSQNRHPLKNKSTSKSGKKHSEDENKKAMLSLLASSSSDDDSISFRKSRRKFADDEKKEKCGPLSSKSLSYQNAHKNDKDRRGVFSDASEGMEISSENEVSLGIKHSGDSVETSQNDVKLTKCTVDVERLSNDLIQKYCDISSSSSSSSKSSEVKKSEMEEIKKLVNLKNLDSSTKKKIPSVDSDSESNEEANVKKKKVFRKHAKKKEEKGKETLKDFHDDNEPSSPSNHSVVSDSNEENKKGGGLKNILDELNKTKNKLAEELLLRSSDSGSDFEIFSKKSKEDKKKNKESKVKVKEENENDKEKCPKKGSDESDESDDEIKKRKKWRSNKLLCMKLSETDTSDEERKWEAKKAKEKKEKEEEGRNKSVGRRRLIDSDSDVISLSSDSPDDDDDSDDFKPTVKRKRKENSDKSEKNSSDSASDQSVKKKPKRRRIRKPASDSSDSNDDGVQNSQKSDNTPNKGRKNIKKVMKDDTLADATRQAAKEEEERQKRITEKQKLYNALYNLAAAQAETVDKLVLDFDPETKEELIQVDKHLVTKFKPHQVKGVKFMWDACFESLERIKENEGSGCILAHCMGLGKTLQVIALTHTLLTNSDTNVKTVLVVCPLSTVLNWVAEFSKWLDESENNDIEVLELTRYKQMYERIGVLNHWHSHGGVLILAYNAYRTLVNPKMKKQKKKNIDTLQKVLVDPGPDLVICDEGHLLKNEESALSKAMSRLKTKRRIVLTGTPLQNNLLEYHCMVQFVKPNLLGTKKEFKNRFINPINNGQFHNSTAHDVKVMKRRAHVLHKMLDSSVQRFDYSVLTPFLPPKFEYVLLIRLTDLQINMYKYYLENLSFASSEGQKTRTARLFSDFQALQRIWTHPRVLLMNAERQEKKQLLEESDSEGSLRDFVVSTSSSESSSTDSDIEEISNDDQKKKHKPKTRSARNNDDNASVKSANSANDGETNETNENRNEWWGKFVPDESLLDDIKQSGKLSLLFRILEECEKIGDKVLVFSQSLLSLDLIEYFLGRVDDASQNDDKADGDKADGDKTEKQKTSWVLGLDYFRLDGSSSPENRSIWCKLFNQEKNYRARLFLISTRAGGLGINLIAANRVVLFDASWNPSYDVQSIFRIYRFGQKKPCYIYRFLAQHTMEEKVYNRQVTKLSLACRVVDEQQIERHYSMDDLQELYNFNPEEKKSKETPLVPKDVLLAELVRGEDSWVDSYHEHDTLLENKEEEELNEEERKAAWEDYEKEKQGLRPSVAMYDNSALIAYLNQFGYSENQIRDSIIKENPQWSEAQIHYHVTRVLKQIHDYVSAEEYRKQLQAQYSQLQQPVFYQAPQTQGLMPTQSHSVLQNALIQTGNPQPGSSQFQNINQRIQVKSFGHMANSNFGNTPQVLINPFASRNGTAGAANGQQKTQHTSDAEVIELK